MTKVFANDHDTALAANNFALIANLLHAWLYLHLLLLLQFTGVHISTITCSDM